MTDTVEQVPVDELSPFDDNPRQGDVGAICVSLEANGQYRPIVVNRRDNVILAGNHTWRAAKSLGWSTIGATFVDVDEATARRIVLVDNRSNDLASYDDQVLADLLTAIAQEEGPEGLVGTGFDGDDLDELLADLDPDVEELPDAGDQDAVPEAPADPVTRRGDVWLLGDHRLLCGDCRDHEDVVKVMGGHDANVVFTSPPYAQQREYDKSSGFTPIKPDEYVDWWEDVQANVRSVLASDGSFFVNIKAHAEDGQRHLYVMDLVLAHVRRWSWLFVDDLCWLRPSPPGRWPNRFKNGHEPVLQFALARDIKFRPEDVAIDSDAVPVPSSQAGANVDGPNGEYWNLSTETQAGKAWPSNVVKIAGVEQGTGHTAAYPVGLPEWFVKAYSDEGDHILDPFLGSGTTIIAAHRTGRTGHGIELSPAYCDVICRRYQEHTGEKPVLESTGEPHDFTG